MGTVRSTIRVVDANIVTAFKAQTIGTKVRDGYTFMRYLEAAIESTDFGAQRVPGQARIFLPDAVRDAVVCGVGRRTLDPADYVARVHRGEVGLYLKRSLAAPVEGVMAVVYTIDAYKADPDVANDEQEMARLANGYSDATHVLVAVIASAAGPKSPLPKGTFLHNLAGGNKEALLYSADEIRSMAKAIDDYWMQWSIVAD